MEQINAIWLFYSIAAALLVGLSFIAVYGKVSSK